MVEKRLVLRYALLLLVLAGAFWVIWARWHWFAPLLHVAWFPLTLVLVTRVFTTLSNAWRFKVAAKVFGLSLRAVEWIGLSAITVLYGRMLPLRLGAAARAVYLKRKHRFSYSDYLSLMLGTNVLELFATGCIGVSACVPYLTHDSAEAPTLMTAFGIALAGATVGGGFGVLAARRTIKTSSQKLDTLIARLQTSAQVYARSGFNLAALLASTLVYLALRAVALWMCFWALGVHVDWVAVAAIMAAGNLTGVLTLTPGNIGVWEGAIIGASTALGIDVAVATPVALLSRATTLLVQVVVGFAFSYVLFGTARPSSIRSSADCSPSDP